jgi:hypothetical protein
MVQRIASLASRLRFGVRRSSGSVFAGRSWHCSKAVVRVPLAGGVVNARAVQWARWSQYSGGRW